MFVIFSHDCYIHGMEVKICTHCKKEKPVTEFHTRKQKRKDGTPYQNGWRAACRICENARRKACYDAKPITRMLMNSKSRAKQRGLEFNITEEDVIIPLICPILKTPLILGAKDDYDNVPSIDRIDSTKGYIKGNVKVISFMANKIKSNATKEQLELFAQNIMSYLNDDIV